MTLSENLLQEAAHMTERATEAQLLEEALVSVQGDFGELEAEHTALVEYAAELEARLAAFGHCGLGGAGGIAALERAGGPLTYHRIYHPNADDVWLSKERDTIAAGRIALSSFKPIVAGVELRWQAIAEATDVQLAWAVKLAKAYGALAGGGYVTCLHEPLDDAKRTSQIGAAYRAMSARLRGIFATYAPSWRWTICLTGYHLTQTGAYAPSEFWDPGARIFAIDEYSGGFMSVKTPAQAFDRARSFAAAHGVKCQIWETGVAPASDQAAWLRALRTYLGAHADVQALSYFNQPHPGGGTDWTLGTEGLAAWGEMAADPWFARQAA